MHDLATLLAYALVAVVAGFVDTLAGGGGLVTIPVLLLGGLPPLLALGTNKLQGTVGLLTSSFSLLRESRLSFATSSVSFVLGRPRTARPARAPRPVRVRGRRSG